jgi:hypothetical protein
MAEGAINDRRRDNPGHLKADYSPASRISSPARTKAASTKRNSAPPTPFA